jgi:hypothetical protein
MPRVTVSLSETTYARLGAIASQNTTHMSKIINKFLEVGMAEAFKENITENANANPAESYCYKLIIEMNTLIKNMSKEILKFGPDDFARLKVLAENKYNEIT